MSLPKPYYQDNAVTLYHGDCLQLLPYVCGHVLLTSPPYGVQENNMASRARFKYGDSNDNITMEILNALALANCRWRFVNVQALSSNKRLIWKWIGMNYERIKDVLVWTKDNPPPQMEAGVLNSAFEFIFCFSDEDAGKRKFDGMAWKGTIGNVLRSSVHANQWAHLHRASFPEWLPKFIVTNFSRAGETIVDGCAGIGTTGRACKDLGRKCVMIEREEKYCEIAAKRMRQEVLPL